MDKIVGYRFHPTDEELVNYFLKHKIDERDFLVDDDIHPIDLCNFEPPLRFARVQWYFFYRREPLNKSKTTSKPRYKRSTKTGTGHWKPTGAERLVKAKSCERVIGIKKNLVFYMRGFPKEVKTNWVINEYEIKNSPSSVTQAAFNRTTKAGCWKPIGKSRKVKATGKSKNVIGTKRTLVFYNNAGHSKPVKSEWFMHEYESTPHVQGPPTFSEDLKTLIEPECNTKAAHSLTNEDRENPLPHHL